MKTINSLVDFINFPRWIFISAVLGFFVGLANCQAFDVSVVSITDGDTLRLKFTNNFEFDARLQGIDAPELTQTKGAYCKSMLENSVAGQSLKIWIIAEDKFNRKLVKLFRADFQEINLSLISTGCAWKFSTRRNDKKLYTLAYKTAWVNCLGLWSARDGCWQTTTNPDIGEPYPSQPPAPCAPRKFRLGKCPEQLP